MLFRNNWHHKHYKNPQQYCTSQSLTSGHVSPSSPSDSQSIKARRSSWTRLIPGGSNSKNERKNKFHNGQKIELRNGQKIELHNGQKMVKPAAQKNLGGPAWAQSRLIL